MLNIATQRPLPFVDQVVQQLSRRLARPVSSCDRECRLHLVGHRDHVTAAIRRHVPHASKSATLGATPSTPRLDFDHQPFVATRSSAAYATPRRARLDGMAAPTLVLWDIDHTLIETRGIGRKLYRAAFEEITGRRMEHKPKLTGRTEPAILTDTLTLNGLEPSDDYQARYAVALARQYEQHTDRLRKRGRALPGARAALASLAQQPNVIQTVLTGNLRAVALIKLQIFELDGFVDLEVGAYGDDEAYRPNLVAIAQQRAGTKYGADFTRSNTVIVGDSPGDVEAGLKGGARVIGVASGKSSMAELRAAGADRVVRDLSDI